MTNKSRLVLDFAPLLAFFIAFKLAGLVTATVTLVAITCLSLAIFYAKERKVALMPLVSGVVVMIFGFLTIYLHDETFIKVKPTILNLLFASVLLIGLCFQKSMLKYLLGDAINLTETGWRQLSFRWGLFFIFLALLNEVVRHNFPTEFWVNFKVFGMFTLTLLFTACQWPLLRKHWIEETPPPA